MSIIEARSILILILTMPTLTRQGSFGSILSSWSDSNTRGPTISLHAAAKPLMRFMYHRQVLAFIKKNRDTPLSKPIMEIYSSYLAFKHLSPSTKTTILAELDVRIASRADANAVAESLLDYAANLLDSPDANVRISTWRVLAELAHHRSTATAVLAVQPYRRLVELLNHKNVEVLETAVCALAYLTQWPDGAQAAVSPEILSCLVKLLDSPNSGIRRWTCLILGDAAQHQATEMAVSGHLCIGLISLLSESDSEVVENATYALSWITYSSHGVEATLNADILDVIPALLKSPTPQVRRWTCRIIGHIALHKSRASILRLNPCSMLVSFLSDVNVQLRESAIYALSWLTQWPEGAQAAVTAKVLQYLPALLQYRKPHVTKWLRRMLKHLAQHEAMALAAFRTQLVPLVRLGTLVVSSMQGRYSALTKFLMWQTKARLWIPWRGEMGREVNDVFTGMFGGRKRRENGALIPRTS
ncbi:armadillo-type protein, partial [Mycena rosella]